MTDVQTLLKEESVRVDTKIEQLLQDAGDLPMYHMLRYFMGYSNDLRQPSQGTHGKRTRSALLLLTAKLFGGSGVAVDLAAAVELFHNFTLIHDDIVDNDEMRRGQPTLWKLWGADHGINSGDAQLLLTNQVLLEVAQKDAMYGVATAQLLTRHFREICEGQYLDFELTKKALHDPLVTHEAYLEMIRKKTAVLVGAAASAGGMSAGCDDEVVHKLFTYGESLGLAYQIVDDYVSIWGEAGATGKRAYGDIIERKKTYPTLYTRDHGDTARLTTLYAKKEALTEEEVRGVVTLFEKAGAREATEAYAHTYVEKARAIAQSLPLDTASKDILMALVEKVALVAGTIESPAT
ncbi:MAG: Polyprenyl synthetase [Parcubacteria group bacterium GW2011_GWA2_43_11]|nr:MAG: Polyprenyl synthetase [Parcubacteria group bacterium GW2011_GWA2_43_11]